MGSVSSVVPEVSDEQSSDLLVHRRRTGMVLRREGLLRVVVLRVMGVVVLQRR